MPASAAFGQQTRIPDAQRSDAHQAELRKHAVGQFGAWRLLGQMLERRLPDDADWWAAAACKGQTHLFYPCPDDPFAPPRADEPRLEADIGAHVGRRATPAAVEHGRPGRLAAASALCRACPVRAECIGYALRLGGSEKQAYLGDMSWRRRKEILAAVRREILGKDRLAALADERCDQNAAEETACSA